jgi:hypothetical protein
MHALDRFGPEFPSPRLVDHLYLIPNLRRHSAASLATSTGSYCQSLQLGRSVKTFPTRFGPRPRRFCESAFATRSPVAVGIARIVLILPLAHSVFFILANVYYAPDRLWKIMCSCVLSACFRLGLVGERTKSVLIDQAASCFLR